MKRKIVIALVEKDTGKAIAYCDTLKEWAKLGECTEKTHFMCLTWESYLRRKN